MDVVNWILLSCNGVLMAALGFLINKTWDRGEKDKVNSSADLESVKNKTDKNEEHISKFRGELGLLNNEIINKIGSIQNLQARIEKDVDQLRIEYRALDQFLRDFITKSARRS